MRLLLDRTDTTGQSSEIGLRLRSPVTRRLFYGVEGSYFFANTDEKQRRSLVVDSSIHDRAKRAALGFGLGYALKPRVVLSFDVAAGRARIRDSRRESSTGNLLEDEKKKAFFLSFHGALQADVWRRLFVSVSLLSDTQTSNADLTLYPDRFGRLMTGDGVFEPNGRTRDRFTDNFSNVGVGWRSNTSSPQTSVRPPPGTPSSSYATPSAPAKNKQFNPQIFRARRSAACVSRCEALT